MPQIPPSRRGRAAGDPRGDGRGHSRSCRNGYGGQPTGGETGNGRRVKTGYPGKQAYLRPMQTARPARRTFAQSARTRRLFRAPAVTLYSRPGAPRRLLAIALAGAVLAVAGSIPFLLSSSSSTSGSLPVPREVRAPVRARQQLERGSDRVRARHHPDHDHHRQPPAAHRPAAPGYSEIAPASAAYFAYVNAHGGVYGRNIVYKYLDDAYDPTTTASVVRQLVLQDNVYAMFNGLGTPTHLAVVSFLNSEKVPDVFVASGCECWNEPTTYPETFGWQLDYVREGKILGQYVKQHFEGKKVGYFYEDDEFGMDGVKGLSYEIPASMVVSRQGYLSPPTSTSPRRSRRCARPAPRWSWPSRFPPSPRCSSCTA